MTLPYSVSLKSRFDGLTYTLTNDIVAIPLVTDTGSGEINTAIIVLSGNGGQYITETPIIDQFDQIQITLTDASSNTYTQTFEVRKTIPQESKVGGTKLEVHMVGLEANLLTMDYIGPHYFTDAFSVVKEIGNYYNANAGNTQPVLVGHDLTTNNKLPTWTTNTYDFGLNEDKCYNRINEVVDKLGASVDAGGVLDFFDIKFRNTFDVCTMYIQSSGSTPVSPITLTNTTAVNIGEKKGGIDSYTGSLICEWGANGMGSLPIYYSQFQSKEIMYPLYKQWDNTVAYPTNARVQWKGILYKCVSPNTNVQPDTDLLFINWHPKTRADEYGTTIAYSPWTVFQLPCWKNSGSNVANQGNSSTEPFGISMWDGNLVLNNDTDTLRVPVDLIARSGDAIKADLTQKKYLYGTTTFYRGLTVLCLGDPVVEGGGTYFGYTAGSPGSAVDINGLTISNSVLQYDGTRWIVQYNASTNMMVSHIYEGDVYQFNTVSAGAWGAIGGLPKGNDCFHPYDSISQVLGVETDGSFTANTNSAIEVKYSWVLQPPILYTDTNANYYKFGAWLNFRFPFPHNNVNSTGLNVGQLYGGTTSSGCEPATLDTQNMNYTHDGLRGFNNASAEDYGQLSSLDFIMKLGYYDSNTNLLITGEANFKMRCLMFDTENNCVYQDFTMPFNNNWEAISLPLSGFAIYRGLKPLWGPADFIVPATQTSPTNVFNWRNLKNICFQTQESYDSSGRYAPILSRYNNPLQLATLGRYIKLAIDAFRFSKPLFVTSGVVSDRVMQPDFIQRPNILFYDQLKNDCLTELSKSQFRHKEFDVTTTLACDVPFSDSLFINDALIVSDSDSGANTIKVVNKRTEYSITKAENGQGGALRTMVTIKRFT